VLDQPVGQGIRLLLFCLKGRFIDTEGLKSLGKEGTGGDLLVFGGPLGIEGPDNPVRNIVRMPVQSVA